MRVTTVVRAMALLALLAGMSTAGVKYVAVVETDVDATSGVSAKLNQAEVREITAELRRQATENLPSGIYSVMTLETVQSKGGAVLEECAEENCVIALGSRIGADYIVRGTISKFQTKFTLAIELYETANGTLVVSSEAIRSENLEELLEKVTAASVNMYKKFVNLRGSARNAPEEKSAVKTEDGGDDETAMERRPMTGFGVGCSFFPRGDGHVSAQLGIVHSRPISKKVVSFNVEGNILVGGAFSYSGGAFGIFGFNVPATVLLQGDIISFEAGVDGDLLFGDDETLFNAGFVAGIGFGKKHSRRYFYRYCYGINYGTHIIGMRWLF